MYGEFEEEYGLLNHAIEIYDRMVFNVDYVDKMEAYNIYIAKVATYLGITKTRAVFEVPNIVLSPRAPSRTSRRPT
jgi:pre-mRNA-splicing factor SYF1